MPSPTPDMEMLSLTAVMADAVTLINEASPVWLYVLGISLGIAILGLVIKALQQYV